MSRDEHYRRMIQSPQWRLLRRQKLNANPLCQDCLADGIYTGATEVHHVHPVEWGRTPGEKERLMFEYANLRSLCPDCHRAAHKALGSHHTKEAAERRKAKRKQLIGRMFGGAVDRIDDPS